MKIIAVQLLCWNIMQLYQFGNLLRSVIHMKYINIAEKNQHSKAELIIISFNIGSRGWFFIHRPLGYGPSNVK